MEAAGTLLFMVTQKHQASYSVGAEVSLRIKGMALNDVISLFSYYGVKTQELTVIQQWKEWFATIPDGKLPTNQKIGG